MTFKPHTVTFHQEAKEVMRITANSVTVTPGVSVDEAAAAVIAALEQHMRNIVAAEREACAKMCEENAVMIGVLCAAAIRARSKA